jgi:hypothetical protein
VKRKYDLGGGVTITDDGHTILAVHQRDDRSSTSIGVRRPPVGPLPAELEVQYSQSRRHFYLPGFAGMGGFWLSVATWPSHQEMQAQQSAGIMGKQGASFVHDDGTTHFREVLPFTYWDVKAERDTQKLARDDEMAKDYLALAQNVDREQEARFNAVIAHTGRTLKWVMDRVGPWQPLPPEPPPTPLTDDSPVVVASC